MSEKDAEWKRLKKEFRAEFIFSCECVRTSVCAAMMIGLCFFATECCTVVCYLMDGGGSKLGEH